MHKMLLQNSLLLTVLLCLSFVEKFMPIVIMKTPGIVLMAQYALTIILIAVY